MGRALMGSPVSLPVVVLLFVGFTACCAVAQGSAPTAGLRRLHSSDAEFNSIGLGGSSDRDSAAAEFASELDLLPRLLQEQLTEDAMVATAAEAIRRALSDKAGELSTPGAYGSSADVAALDSPSPQPAGSADGMTSQPTAAGNNTQGAKPTGLEAATRAPSQSVAGASGPVAAHNSAGKVVEQLSGGQTAGIVVGLLAAAALVALGVFGYQKYKKNRQGDDYISHYRRYDGDSLIEMH